MSDHIQEIQSILDSNKEAMTDGLYLELSNIAAKIYTEKKNPNVSIFFRLLYKRKLNIITKR